MNATGKMCRVSGFYSAYAPCGHAQERWIEQGDSFPGCSVCGHTAVWTLLRETDRWRDYDFAAETPDSKYRGMTVNERLFSANLMDEFEDATESCDRSKMISLLQHTGISLPWAERVTDSVLTRQSQK